MNEKFDNALLKNGFLSVEVDKCVYTKCTEKECVIIALYVDDMLIFGTSLSMVHSTKRFLASQFDMKDMGEVKVILGVKIIRMGDSIMLSQEHYIEKIFKRFGDLGHQSRANSLFNSKRLELGVSCWLSGSTRYLKRLLLGQPTEIILWKRDP